MGRKRVLNDEVRTTVSLERADYERMKEVYSLVGVSAAFRALVRAHLDNLDARRIAETEKLATELKLELE